jgi:hypothetical protein
MTTISKEAVEVARAALPRPWAVTRSEIARMLAAALPVITGQPVTPPEAHLEAKRHEVTCGGHYKARTRRGLCSLCGCSWEAHRLEAKPAQPGPIGGAPDTPWWVGE